MSTSLDHLPEHKQAQLRAITALICDAAPVDMVILFGSYARGDWVEDPARGYFSDYDLLVVVGDSAIAADEKLWSRLTEQARRITGRVPVTLMPHDFREVNAEVRTGQYFFSDIMAQGILLHDSKRITLSRPKAVNAQERLALGEWSFRYWFTSAGGFWQGTGYYAAKGLLSHGAFLLHQSVERYYHAVLLVFTGYKPKTHDIEWLADETASLHEALSGAMPRTQPEDEQRFSLLKRAYVEARYSKSYRITAEELGVLREQVSDLAARVRRACAEKLATILGPEAVSELPSEPKTADPDELPEPPAPDEPEAMERWRDAIVELSEARGEARGLRVGRDEGLREGRQVGRDEGRYEGRRDLISQQLETRFGALPADKISRLLSGTAKELDVWAERVLTAASLDEVFRS